MRSTFLSTVLNLTMLFAPTSYAFVDLGHEVIARIAWSQMTPSARSQAAKLLYSPTVETDDDRFALSAVWPDDFKSYAHVFDRWHYMDSEDKGQLKKGLCTELKALLTPTCKTCSEDSRYFSQALMLRMLIHAVGDTHQPLHTGSRNGDKGGNTYRVRLGNKLTNLHLLWDFGVGYLGKPGAARLETKEQIKQSRELASKLMAAYPKSKLDAQSNNLVFSNWLAEGRKTALDFVYTTPENMPVNDAYLKEGSQIMERTIALAGYRLGALLNGVFEKGALATGCDS